MLPFAIVASLFPPFQELTTLPELLSRRLIDTAPGARGEFHIQAPK